MKRYAIVMCLVAVGFFASCAHRATAVDMNDLGNSYYDVGDHKRALGSYRIGFTLAEKKGDLQYEAITMYGMARSSARLCQTSEAEEWFMRSIEARRKLPNLHEEAYLTQNILEFGRFLSSQSRNLEAVALYDEAMPMLKRLEVEYSDPNGFVTVLREYENLLRINNRDKEADSAAKKASLLEFKNLGTKPHYRPQEYPNCL
ncbi:hypothetical protein [Marinicella sp. W31]|uniref:hypothetical protein n=1 Tax=Marinicella sp. W31 TaxID=3023713 RepID=UPI003756C18F